VTAQAGAMPAAPVPSAMQNDNASTPRGRRVDELDKRLPLQR
jgi:hypothetical protein